MKLKVKYIAGVFRLLCNKIIFRKRLQLCSFFQYIGKNSEISIAADSQVRFGDRNYLTSNCYVGAHNNSSLIIGKNNFFNRNTIIECLDSIVIGDNNLFGPNIIIVDHNHKFSDKDCLICKQGYTTSPVKIGSNIWIGGNVTICEGVTIADNVVVGANSVVVRSLLESGIYVGNPAKKIKDLY